MTTLCPLPVYPANAPLADLGTAEMLLTSTLRFFVMEWHDPGGPHPDWRGGFVYAGIDATAVPAFDRLLGIVALMTVRPLDMRCPRCRFLGEDEGRLLQFLSLLQHGRASDAAAILTMWLPPTATRMAMLPGEGLATAMRRGGLIVPMRHAAGPVQHPNVPHHADRGLHLIQ